MIDWKKYETEAAKKVVFYPNDEKYLITSYSNSNLGVVVVAAITAFIICKAFK